MKIVSIIPDVIRFLVSEFNFARTKSSTTSPCRKKLFEGERYYSPEGLCSRLTGS